MMAFLYILSIHLIKIPLFSLPYLSEKIQIDAQIPTFRGIEELSFL